jgi:hypothetical protein
MRTGSNLRNWPIAGLVRPSNKAVLITVPYASFGILLADVALAANDSYAVPPPVMSPVSHVSPYMVSGGGMRAFYG